jgi:hypothetical protein
MGRPVGFDEVVGLPGSFRSTKRFINATRAGGDIRENASLLRTVRKRTKPAWFWEQVAVSTAFSAPLGPPLLGDSLDAPAELSIGLELDSCEAAFAAASRREQLSKKSRLRNLNFRKCTSILCGT